MMKGEGRGEHGDEEVWSGGMGEEGFEFFDAHCHIDRVLINGSESQGCRGDG